MKIEDLLYEAGGVKELVRLTGLWPQAIYKWKKHGVPEWHEKLVARRARVSVEVVKEASRKARGG